MPKSEQTPIDPNAPPSRSQQRREALDVLQVAESLATMTDAQLAPIALDDDLLAEIHRARAFTSHVARKRQVQFLAKQLRRDEQATHNVRAALEQQQLLARRSRFDLHRAEVWRDRLLAEGDDSLGELLASHPDADRQRLRQLIRQALADAKAAKPPRAARELFRVLREMLSDDAAEQIQDG